MVDFSEEIENAVNEKTLILGNGFGISYDSAFESNHFSWNTLLELCDIEEGSPLYGLLAECNFDFELVHQKLNNAIDILTRYSPENALIHDLQNQVQTLRDQLTIAVANSHPQSFNIDFNTENGRMKKQKIEACREFLRKFSKVFSLNYDLLLYWVRCFERNCLGQDSFDNEDGDLVFYPDPEANYLFPHGEMAPIDWTVQSAF